MLTLLKSVVYGFTCLQVFSNAMLLINQATGGAEKGSVAGILTSTNADCVV